MKFHKCAAAVLATVFAAVAVQAADPPVPGGNSFVISDVRVFDGVRVLDDMTVIVRDGRIETVGARVSVPAGLAAVDGAGKTLLPGFIDAHTHSWGDAQRDALRFGVGTELDMLGDWNRLPALKAQRESLARTAQADLWSAGAAVTAPKGHGTQFGMPVPTLAADGDANAFVAARATEGSDYIKLIVEDMSAHGASARWPTLTPAQVVAGIAAAHAVDKRAVVHVSHLEDARHAIANGADGLVHAFLDPADAAFVRLAKQRNAFVVPTLSVIATMAQSGEGAALVDDPRLRPWLTAEQNGTLKAVYPGAQPRPVALENALQTVRALHGAGVDILAGTDAGNPGTTHGASLHGELALLVRAGLTPLQAIAAATSVPARRFGLHDRGRIAAGMRADLVLVEGDPTLDITATRAIASVWKNGYAIARDLPRQADVANGEAMPTDTLVSDFESGIASSLGAGWQPTTDQMMGGASTVAFARADAGANGSRGALRVSGEIKPGFAYPWSGVMLFPARQPMQPVDMSSRKELVFQARGDGRTYQLMLFSGAQAQAMPSVQTFVAGKTWTEVRVPLSAFPGADPARVRGIAFTAGQPEGSFDFQIDQVELR